MGREREQVGLRSALRRGRHYAGVGRGDTWWIVSEEWWYGTALGLWWWYWGVPVDLPPVDPNLPPPWPLT